MHFPSWIFKVLFFAALLVFQRVASRRGRGSAPAGRASETRVPTSSERMSGPVMTTVPTPIDRIGKGVVISSKPLTPK